MRRANLRRRASVVKFLGRFFSSALGSAWLAVWLATASTLGFGQSENQGAPPDTPTSSDSMVDLLDPNTSHALMNLETGQPLGAVLSPLHWGQFSVLSFSAYEGYDTNTQLEVVPLGSSLTSINALAIYAIEGKKSEFDVQYHPFLWLSHQQTFKELGSTSSDLHAEFPISGHWSWSAGDSFRYSPNLESTIEGNSFSGGSGLGTPVGTPFLSEGFNMMTNAFTLGVQDQYGQWSSLRFRGDADYIRLSEFLGGSSQVPASGQALLNYGGGVAWTNRLDYANTFDVSYVYRFQRAIDSPIGNAQYHLATFTWSHLFTESFRLKTGVGPAWLISDSSHSVVPTLQGSVELFKQFRKGGVALLFARSDQFSGVIGIGFNNRVDLSVDRHFGTRWSAALIASYLKQGVLSGPNATGKQASAEIDHFLTRNWSVFVQGRYLRFANIGPTFAPQEIATVGFRWSWVPDKP